MTIISRPKRSVSQSAIQTLITDVQTLATQVEGSTKDWKESVRAATTANISLAGTQTIDGVALVAGDRVLVKNQAVAADNGIYVVATGAWSRSTDADTSEEVTAGAATVVEEGASYAESAFVLSTSNPITLGVTPLTFVQFVGGLPGPHATTHKGGGADVIDNATGALAGLMSATDKSKLDGLPSSAVPTTRALTAGAGLTGGGDLSADRTFDVVAADATIVVGANDIRVGTVQAANIGSLTSAELATILSDETGTGAAVFGASPTIATPALTGLATADRITATSTSGAALTGLGQGAGVGVAGTGGATGNGGTFTAGGGAAAGVRGDAASGTSIGAVVGVLSGGFAVPGGSFTGGPGVIGTANVAGVNGVTGQCTGSSDAAGVQGSGSVAGGVSNNFGVKGIGANGTTVGGGGGRFTAGTGTTTGGIAVTAIGGQSTGGTGGVGLNSTGGAGTTGTAGNGVTSIGGATTGAGTGGDGVKGTGGATVGGTPGVGVRGDGGAAGYGVVAQATVAAAPRAALRIVPQTSAPTIALKGDVYFDGTLNKLRVYSGAAWETVTSI